MPKFFSFARSVCATALALLSLLIPLKPAVAADYSDLWVTANENAWGVNFVQWGSTIYATFYVYGADSKPVWFTAVMGYDGSSKFAGLLYTYTGTYFALPWNDSEWVETPSGTASFQPSATNSYEGTLNYTIFIGGVAKPITKPLRRLPNAAAIPLAGTYYGGLSGAYSGCSNSGDNAKFVDSYPLQVTQSSSTSVSLTFTFADLGATCTLAGNLQQNGQLFSIPTATYLCSDGLDTTAVVSDLKITAQGIEGVISAPVVYGSCRENSRFSAVRN
ncbi:MAG TPA: hypothetical protein PLW68_12615 [Casimicrobiaceae bacterium]|nr:hypothetical protein [Casimicrobiaceae bacterium]